MNWIAITAAGVFLFSLLEAWIATLIVYAKIEPLRKVFKVPRNLIRSHVDYLMQTGLLGFVFLMCEHLELTLPQLVIFLMCFGAIYNPCGFLVQSINPSAGRADTTFGKLVVCASFIPTTIGYGYAMVVFIADLAT